MTFDVKKIIGTPVETLSGTSIGKVATLHIDPLTHTIAQYEVRRHGLLGDLMTKELLVSATQVVSLDEQKMVVDDLLAGEAATAPGVSRPAPSPSN